MPHSVLNLWQFAMAIQQKHGRTETETNLKMPECPGSSIHFGCPQGTR